MCVYNYTTWSGMASITRKERDVIGCLFLAVIALFSVSGELKKVKWNRQIVFIWYGLAALIFVSGLSHAVGYNYWLWSVTLLVGFPGFYLIWQNRQDYETLFDIVSSAMVVIFLISFVLCLCTISQEVNISGRYWGIMKNPNLVGRLAVSCVTAVLYLFFRIRYKCLLGAVYGICVILIVLSGSRASLLVISGQTIIWLILNFKYYRKSMRFSEILIPVMAFVLISILCGFIARNGLEYCQEINDREFQEEIVEEEEPVVSQNKLLTQNSEALKSRLDILGKTPDEISSGRIGIWKHFISQINFFGNDFKQYKSGTPEAIYQWAHNDVIEISFRSGIFAGIFVALFWMYLGIYILRVLFFDNKDNKYHFFTIFIVFAYGIYAMVEVIYYPFSMQDTFMFFVSLMPVFERRNELCLRCKSQ